MGKKLYVGNLPYSTNDADLRALFEKHGQVLSASVISDRETGRSRGFGFVEMDDAAGKAACEQLDQHEFEGRRLTVNEAKPQERSGGGYAGGGRSNGGGFGRQKREARW